VSEQRADVGRIAAICYTVVSAGVVVFQLALAAGAPWGSYAMGGAFPGQFPPAMRVAAIVQAALLLVLAGVMLARAGVALPRWHRVSRWLAWVIVAFSVVGLVLNLITPSGGERMIWAPVAAVQLVCAVLIVGGRPLEANDGKVG
jgi:hypothetical protein